MASTSSINSNSSGSQAPNPPPRTHSRPNQPPPPPPLPTVPPVPPVRDSSMAINKPTIHNGNKHHLSSIPPGQQKPLGTVMGAASNGVRFLSQFEPLFKPLEELPPPDPFTDKPKTYHSQRVQQKQPEAPRVHT